MRINGVLEDEIYPPRGLINASLERVLERVVLGDKNYRIITFNSSVGDLYYYFSNRGLGCITVFLVFVIWHVEGVGLDPLDFP